jgi:hypothetical protein
MHLCHDTNGGTEEWDTASSVPSYDMSRRAGEQKSGFIHELYILNVRRSHTPTLYLKRQEQAIGQFELVHMDLLTGNVTSLEGFFYAFRISYNATMYQCEYDLKTKVDANAMIRKWVSNTYNVHEQHQIKMIVRDNA